MKYETKRIRVGDLTKGYTNTEESGTTTMGGKLNIRPAYQREFIYKDKQRDAVIETLDEDMPIGILHGAKTGEDTYEVLDGQQRTISIAEYITGNFSVDYKGFNNLSPDKRKELLDYEILVNVYEGNDDEKLKWFRKINIAGEKLTDQELRNAVYTGTGLTDAKRHFSKNQCVAYQVGKDLVKGSPIRQDYLQTAIKGIADRDGIAIEEYMAKHQHDVDAHELGDYFRAVIEWVGRIFEYRKEMKGIDGGILYNQHKDDNLNKAVLESNVKAYMIDDDVTKKSGIYTYLLNDNEKFLSIRAFTDKNKREVFEKQNGICVKCNKAFELKEMHADHIIPWSKGGKTLVDNCQMLCAKCNATKGNK